MSFSWKKSIGTRFTIVTVLLVSLITMLFFGFDAAVSYRKELARLNQELVQIQYSHLPSLISSLWQTDYPLLQQQIDAIARFPYIGHVEVENDEGDTFHAGRGDISGLQLNTEQLFYTRRGIKQNIGSLRLFIDQEQMRREVLELLGISLLGHALGMLTVIAAVLLLFRYLVARHLESLALSLESGGHGDLDAPFRLHRRLDYPDELHSLVDAINAMRQNLHRYLKERELLVSEIHHRIKNDMGFIKALLSLQADLSESPEVKSAVKEASQRLSVMTRIYERLYGDENFLEVAVRPLAGKVVADLRELGKLPTGIIELAVDDFKVPTKLSVSIGIILNELLTNAMKYAFTTAEATRIDASIHTRVEEKTVELTVRDNGSSIPGDVIDGSRRGYGLTIVDALVKQHCGTLTLSNDGGSVVRVVLQVR